MPNPAKNGLPQNAPPTKKFFLLVAGSIIVLLLLTGLIYYFVILQGKFAADFDLGGKRVIFNTGDNAKQSQDIYSAENPPDSDFRSLLAEVEEVEASKIILNRYETKIPLKVIFKITSETEVFDLPEDLETGNTKAVSLREIKLDDLEKGNWVMVSYAKDKDDVAVGIYRQNHLKFE